MILISHNIHYARAAIRRIRQAVDKIALFLAYKVARQRGALP